MNRRRVISCLAAACSALLLASMVLQAQTIDWKTRLQAQLETAYRLTKVATFDINSVTSPGVVMVIQKEGISADRAHAIGTLVTKVVDGQPQVTGGGLFSRGSATGLEPGDKIYVFDQIKVKDDSVQFQLLTVGRRDIVQKGSTEHTRFKASVRFDFPKGYLVSASLGDVQKTIEEVLAPETTSNRREPAARR